MKYLITFILLVLLISCEKDEFETKKFNLVTSGVFICNEGNYMSSNASLSYLDAESNTINNNLFFSANGYPLGDVAQSMAIIDSVGYVVINNSGKIYAININTFKYLGVIEGLQSPRNILVINKNKAYVSSLYSKEIAIIDPENLQITGSINAGKTTEQMVLWNGNVFVTNWSYNKTIQKIDPVTDEIIAEAMVAKQPNSLVVDKNNKLWVLCDGGYEGSSYGQDTAALCRLDAESLDLEKTIRFPKLSDSPSRLTINSSGDTLFFINGNWEMSNAEYEGVYVLPVMDESLLQRPLIAQNGRNFYGLAYDPAKQLLYVSDVIDYMQRGWVYRYKTSGEKIDSFQAGITPGYFCFKTKIEGE